MRQISPFQALRAIEYRLHPDPKANSHLLFRDQIVPIASPSLIAEKQISCLDDLKNIPLIETERRLASWQWIFTLAGKS